MEKKVKTIEFRITLKGRGIVNYDQSDIQKKMFNTSKNDRVLHFNHDNIKLAKKVFLDKNDLSNYKIKISSNCLKNHLFGDNHNPNIVHHNDTLLAFLASPNTILRGFLFANKVESYKKSTALYIRDAIQTCDSKSYVEVNTRSGYKDVAEDKEKSDTTLFYTENIGDIEYETSGNIDIEKLQFISTDQLYDRFALNPDMFPVFKDILKNYLPSFDSELKYFRQKSSANILPESGFVLNNETINELVKISLLKTASVRIERNTGNAYVHKMEFRPVYDCIDNDEEWITILDRDNSDIKARKIINNISYNYEDFYVEIDNNESKKIRENLNNNTKTQKNKEALAKAKKDLESNKYHLEKAKASDDIKKIDIYTKKVKNLETKIVEFESITE